MKERKINELNKLTINLNYLNNLLKIDLYNKNENMNLYEKLKNEKNYKNILSYFIYEKELNKNKHLKKNSYIKLNLENFNRIIFINDLLLLKKELRYILLH